MTASGQPGTADPVHKPPRRLIASDRVVGTEVRRPDGGRVGRIERLMLDKVSGRVAYAVMSFGGFLGLGEDFYTLPWSVLRFEPRQDAYVVDVTEAQLRAAPARTPEGTDPAEDGAWEDQIHRYYDAAPYWGI
ncbi:PRC-barrel domain-containing protein [Methylobacterium sp. UNC378MF]|uniref:PRC-barrel domain-containing protein n=1 Tax=Methylobacterium sp. UNC378MF TaxID=1502748 RepID=UPI00088D10C1|nr:PRC-barrel domain-containing protein [Methylobacterium sp. UNC378MF]SDA28427.1 PRC-barrel domain-containing protein [Methylobacterium sp. UNC378MF]